MDASAFTYTKIRDVLLSRGIEYRHATEIIKRLLDISGARTPKPQQLNNIQWNLVITNGMCRNLRQIKVKYPCAATPVCSQLRYSGSRGLSWTRQASTQLPNARGLSWSGYERQDRLSSADYISGNTSKGRNVAWWRKGGANLTKSAREPWTGHRETRTNGENRESKREHIRANKNWSKMAASQHSADQFVWVDGSH